MRTRHEVPYSVAGLRGVLLDFDGTMAHTESGHRLAYNRAFAELGLDWNWTDHLYAETPEFLTRVPRRDAKRSDAARIFAQLIYATTLIRVGCVRGRAR